eukprot:TRINITY_DN15399_c3_g1_i1.p1 TRINITY_DN15399_c3_g1~~TRINITY_DN15399_c3_g1_i1.p1  ORF type:complete len:480 (+),score=196.35 TRINITY_DN15399_c3_g1_i1:125-1564(+)
MFGMGGEPMISAEETKKMLRQGLMPGMQPPQAPAAEPAAAAPPQAAPVPSRRPGPTPEQTHYFRVSAAMTLLDLRVEERGGEPVGRRDRRRTPADPAEDAIPEDADVCVQATRHSLAGRFVNKAHGWLCDAFQPLGVGLGVCEEGGCVRVRLLADGAPLKEGRARRMVAELEDEAARMGADDAIEWCKLTEDTILALKKLLACLPVAAAAPDPDDGHGGVDPRIRKDQLAAVAAEPIIPTGAEGLEQYEVGFAAGGAVLQYPQPKLFEEAHWKLWAKQAPYPRRRLLEQVYAMATWVPHEVLHCVQDSVLGTAGAGKSPLANWQCEYCVCFGQALLFEALIAEQRKMGSVKRTLPLPSHMPEESQLWLDAAVRVSAPAEARSWAAEWWSSRAQRIPIPSEQDTDGWYHEHRGEYLGLLGTVALSAFERVQSVVETDDEQRTSYWMELIKYLNRVLKSETEEAVAAVAHGLQDMLAPAEP